MEHYHYVIMSNEGGELERRPAGDEADARRVLLELIEGLPFVSEGDSFTIEQK
jgi:hypothetical protein